MKQQEQIQKQIQVPQEQFLEQVSILISNMNSTIVCQRSILEELEKNIVTLKRIEQKIDIVTRQTKMEEYVKKCE